MSSRLDHHAPTPKADNGATPPPSPMRAGNQLAGREAAERAMEEAATKQYTAAWQWVYQPEMKRVPARGTPAYVACLSVSALRQAERVRKSGGSAEEVDRLKDSALQWRRALMYPMRIEVIGRSLPEYTDAPAGSSLDVAAEIATLPDLSRPFYQGGLVLASINRGTRVMALYPTTSRTR